VGKTYLDCSAAQLNNEDKAEAIENKRACVAAVSKERRRRENILMPVTDAAARSERWKFEGHGPCEESGFFSASEQEQTFRFCSAGGRKGESGQKAIFDAKPKTRSRQAAKTTGCLEIEPMEHALFSFPLLLLRSADQVTVMI